MNILLVCAVSYDTSRLMIMNHLWLYLYQFLHCIKSFCCSFLWTDISGWTLTFEQCRTSVFCVTNLLKTLSEQKFIIIVTFAIQFLFQFATNPVVGWFGDKIAVKNNSSVVIDNDAEVNQYYTTLKRKSTNRLSPLSAQHKLRSMSWGLSDTPKRIKKSVLGLELLYWPTM